MTYLSNFLGNTATLDLSKLINSLQVHWRVGDPSRMMLSAAAKMVFLSLLFKGK